MKKFLFAMLCVLCVNSTAFAQEAAAPVTNGSINVVDIIKKIPALKQGVAYSILDSRFNYITTMDAFNYSGVNLEVGYSGIAKNTGDKVIAIISYDLWDAKKAGVTIPVLDLIKFRPGIYAGAGHIGRGTSEFDWGVSATLIDVKL